MERCSRLWGWFWMLFGLGIPVKGCFKSRVSWAVCEQVQLLISAPPPHKQCSLALFSSCLLVILL